MKRSVILYAGLIIGAVGIAIAPVHSQEETVEVTHRAVYQCDDGKSFTANYKDNNTVQATFGSKVITLQSVETGSGAKYSDGSVTIFTKGNEAFVEVGNNRLFENCIASGSAQGLW